MEVLVFLGFLGFIIGVLLLILSFIKRNKKTSSLIVILCSFIIFFVGVLNMPANTSSTSSTTASSTGVSASSASAPNDSSSNSSTTPSAEENYQNTTKVSAEDNHLSDSERKIENEEYEEINELIAQHLKDNQGWALGTIDNMGNPVEDGTPDPEYAVWPFVRSITWNGSDVEVQVTADFQNFTKAEKELVASSSQGIAMSYAELSDRPSVYIYNGETSYGHSGIINRNSYTWN